jgi:hypothetical protein
LHYMKVLHKRRDRERDKRIKARQILIEFSGGSIMKMDDKRERERAQAS